MDGIYECLVKTKTPVYAPFVKAFAVALVVIAFFAGMMLNLLFLAVAIGLGVAAYFLLPFLAVEWEYIFIDGSFQVDRILAQAKRKTIKEYTFDHIDVIAPLNSPDISRNLNNPGVQIVDYSAKQGEEGVYGMLYADQGGRYLVLIEPNEKVLKALRKYSPRKVTIA